MKKLFSFTLFLLYSGVYVNAQITNQDILKEIKKENIKKTGNWQDVFASFYQLALKDLSGNKKAFEFKSTIFALRSAANPNLLIDTNFVKKQNVFGRNFQVQTGLRLDSSYKFQGISLGFNWAIINKRDSAILSFKDAKKIELERKNEIFFKALITAKNTFDKEYPNQTEKSLLIDSLINEQVSNGKFDTAVYPEQFMSLLKLESAQMEIFNETVKTIKAKVEETKLKPLLTFGILSNFKKGSNSFDGLDAELIYLQGVTRKNKPIELDVRIRATVEDTVIGKSKNRSIINMVGGFNYTIVTSGESAIPLVEFKPHLEYNIVTNGLYNGEKSKVFSANATLRIRVIKNVWIPLTLKYDVENNNFLGFLNATFNWDAFKNK